MNTLFQFIWFSIVKPFIKRKQGEGVDLVDYHKRIITQVKLATFFGVRYIIIGDSNGENLATYKNMTQFGKGLNAVIANIAIGGTRADSWVDYFSTKEGREVLETLPVDVFVIFNIGGNHVLQKKMDLLPAAFKDLKHIVERESCNCLVPPVHYSVLKDINPDAKKDVTKCNTYIKKVWSDRYIDVHTPFKTKDDEPLFFIHQDVVHFSDNVDRLVRIPIMIEAIKSFVA